MFGRFNFLEKKALLCIRHVPPIMSSRFYANFSALKLKQRTKEKSDPRQAAPFKEWSGRLDFNQRPCSQSRQIRSDTHALPVSLTCQRGRISDIS